MVPPSDLARTSSASVVSLRRSTGREMPIPGLPLDSAEPEHLRSLQGTAGDRSVGLTDYSTPPCWNQRCRRASR
jgi:hypothetical protein